MSFLTVDGGVSLRPEWSHLQRKLLLYPLPIAREASSAFLMQEQEAPIPASMSPCWLALSTQFNTTE